MPRSPVRVGGGCKILEPSIEVGGGRLLTGEKGEESEAQT